MKKTIFFLFFVLLLILNKKTPSTVPQQHTLLHEKTLISCVRKRSGWSLKIKAEKLAFYYFVFIFTLRFVINDVWYDAYINRLQRLGAKNDRQAYTKKNTYDTALRPRYSVYNTDSTRIHTQIVVVNFFFLVDWFS